MGKSLTGKELGKGISQRKDGRYEARCMINGTKINLYNLNLAKLKKEFEEQKAKVLLKEKNQFSEMKLSDWFEEWFDNYKKPRLKSEQSAKVYHRKVANTYIKELGDKKLSDVSNFDVQTATNELVSNYKNRQIKEALSVFNQCMETAQMNGAITSNPCNNIVIKKCDISPKEKRVLKDWEIEILFKVAANSFYFEPLAILLNTGLRIGEFGALQWEDVDFDNKCIYVRHSMMTCYDKGRKQEIVSPKSINGYRTVPFFEGVEQLFLSWKKKVELYKQDAGSRWQPVPEFGNLVFSTTLGTPLTRYNFVHTIKKFENDMQLYEINQAIAEGRSYRKIEHIHPHAFRHTFATICFCNKLDPIFVQRIMGHADYKTTLVYTHITESTANEEIRKFNNPIDTTVLEFA